MGANMARRLKDRGFHVTSVYDTNRGAATELASELGCAAAQDLSEVTAASDVISTVVELVVNAFIQALVPGLEHTVGADAKQAKAGDSRND